MTSSALTPYLFESEHLVRTIERDGEPWFVGLDVCRTLGIKDHHQKLDGLDDDERGRCSIPTPSGDQSMIVVSEPGIYRLVFSSKKPIAERFKRWLAHEVIPAIRRTGSYGPQPSTAAPSNEPLPFPNWPMDEMRTKLKCVDGYRLLYGIMAAQWVSPQLGFPSPPPEYVERGRQFTLTLVPNPPKDDQDEKEAA